MPSLASACLSVAIVAQVCVRLSLPGPLSHTVICYVVYKLILLEVLQRLSACCSALFFQNIEETSGEHFERFDAVKDIGSGAGTIRLQSTGASWLRRSLMRKERKQQQPRVKQIHFEIGGQTIEAEIAMLGGTIKFNRTRRRSEVLMPAWRKLCLRTSTVRPAPTATSAGAWSSLRSSASAAARIARPRAALRCSSACPGVAGKRRATLHLMSWSTMACRS